MAGKEKRKQLIQELLFAGYTQEKIAKKLNISIRTVARDVRKIRDGAKTWLDELASKNFVHLYRETFGGLEYNIMYLRDMLEDDSIKSNNIMKLKIIKEIAHMQYKKAELLHKGPMVWSIDKVMRKKDKNPIPVPEMESIWGENEQTKIC